MSLCKWLYPIWNFNGGTSPGPWTLARGSGPDLAQALALGQDLAPASCSLYPYPRFAKSSQVEGVLVGFSLWLASQSGPSKTTKPLEYIKNVCFFLFFLVFFISCNQTNQTDQRFLICSGTHSYQPYMWCECIPSKWNICFVYVFIFFLCLFI